MSEQGATAEKSLEENDSAEEVSAAKTGVDITRKETKKVINDFVSIFLIFMHNSPFNVFLTYRLYIDNTIK